MKRTALLAPALVAVAVVLGGCDDILDDQASQPDLIGNPTVTTKRCFFGGKSDTAPYTCDSIASFSDDRTLQGLIAYQVPVGVGEPSGFDGVTDAVGDIRRTSYSFSQSYTDQLEATSPAPPGMKWRGYISAVETFTVPQEVPQVETISATFAMPRGPDGTPAHGPFQWLTIVGMRYSNSTDLLPGRPLSCSAPDTFCRDYPASLPPLSSLQTSDFGITAPAPQSGQAGTPIDVTFGWELAGPAIGAPFSLSAHTDIPGGGGVPLDGILTPAPDSKGTELVRVTEPASTPTGDYHVALTATLPNGQTRSSSAPVHIAAVSASTPSTAAAPVNAGPVANKTAPKLTLAVPGSRKLRNALAHGLSLDLGCSEACTLTVALLVERKIAKELHISSATRVRVGRRTVSLPRAGQVRVRVDFTKKAKKRLRGRSTIALTVNVAAADAAGNGAVTTRRLRLR